MSDHPQSPDETPSATDPGVDAADSLAALAAENAALKEQVLRYAADAENVRRRAERETNDARAYAIQKFARDLLMIKVGNPPPGADSAWPVPSPAHTGPDR